jgi:hypothetical protein
MKLDLETIRARVAAASPGPWARHGPDVHSPAGLILHGADGASSVRQQADRDAEFVAHARTDLAALIEEITHLRGHQNEDTLHDGDRPPATEIVMSRRDYVLVATSSCPHGWYAQLKGSDGKGVDDLAVVAWGVARTAGGDPVPVGIVVDSSAGALRIAEQIENFGGYSQNL